MTKEECRKRIFEVGIIPVVRASSPKQAMQAAEAQATSAKARLKSEQGTNEHLAAAAKTPGVVAANDLMVGNESVEAARGGAAAAGCGGGAGGCTSAGCGRAGEAAAAGCGGGAGGCTSAG